MPSSIDALASLSSLTEIQVETLKLHRAVSKSQITMGIALKSRKIPGISRGTHYRILTQAKKNIKESLFTVATAVQLGLLRPEEVQRLVATVTAVPEDLDADQLSDVLGLIEVLVDRIVMF